jgi:hypothetical protein
MSFGRRDLKATLISLKDYQDVLVRIEELDHLLSEVPPEIVELETEWKSIQERLEDLKTRRKEQESKLKELGTSLKEASAKSQKFENDLHEVTNTKEYNAVLKEIDTAKRTVKTLEEEIAQRKKDLEEIKANTEECTTLEKQSHKKYKTELSKHEGTQVENREEREDKARERDKLAEKLPTRIIRQFERIASRRNGIGLAVCQQAVCNGCNVRVRPSVVDELRKHRRLITCESCKRILFFSEGDE